MSDLDLMDGVSDPTPGITPAKIPGEAPVKETLPAKEPVTVKEVTPEPVVKDVKEPPKKLSIKESVADAVAKVKKPVEGKKDEPVKVDAPVVAATSAEKKLEAPVGWTAEAKSKWDSLDKDVQESVLKREKEVSDGFKGTGEATKRVKTIDQVVDRLVPDNKNYGGADKVIENTLSWLSAFRNPNKQFAATQLLAAAQSFGILDQVKTALGGVAPSNTATNVTPTAATTPVADPKVAELERKLSSLEAVATQQELARNKSTLDDWSKDKPHFEKVRKSMTNLFNSGEVAMDPSGQFTKAALDEAYNTAVRLNAELYAESLEKERKKVADDYEAKARKAEQLRQAQNSKVAASSIKNSPPAAKVALNGVANVNRKSNIRDTIRSAVKEVNTR